MKILGKIAVMAVGLTAGLDLQPDIAFRKPKQAHGEHSRIISFSSPDWEELRRRAQSRKLRRHRKKCRNPHRGRP